MGKLDRITLTCLLALLALGCSSKREQPAWARTAAQQERCVPVEPSAQPTDPRFDASGALRPSGTHVSWLELPSGFRERPGNSARMAAYEARDMPYDKVRAYLEQRLVPKNALYLRTGFEYLEAGPAHTALELPPMHVTVLKTNEALGEVRLVIEDLTPSPAPPVPPAAAAALLANERARQD